MHRTLRTSNVHFYPWEIRIPLETNSFPPYRIKEVTNLLYVYALLSIQFHRVLTGKGQLSVEIAEIRREFGLVVGRNEEVVT